MTSERDGIVGACGVERNMSARAPVVRELTRKTFIEPFGGYVSASGGRQGGDKSRR
jgi:hypothetical protein